MANQLMDAITQSVISGMDPSAAMARDYMQAITQEKLEDVTERQAKTIENLTVKLAKAKTDGAPQEVIDAYSKLLARYK